MPRRGRARSGDWLYVCQRCGRTKYASQIRPEWTGLRVCGTCWEPRHPQDLVRAKKDDIVPPFSNTPYDIDLEPNEVSFEDYQVLSPDGSIVLAEDLEPVIAEH